MSASTAVIFDIIGRDKASNAFDKVGNSADRTGGKMGKLGGILKTSAKAGLFGVAVGAGLAGKALFDMAKGASEDAAGQVRLAKAMQNAAGASRSQVAATEDWISAQGKALGVADDDLRPALEKLVVATGDVGKAQKLASLGMDVAAGTGMSLEMVSKSLAKAQNGQVSGLSRLGISTKDAEGKTISFAEAQKRLAAAHGGQASTAANTLQGKMGRLKLILAETGEEIGAKMIPVITRMADWFLNKGLPAIQRFSGYLSTNVPPVIAKIKAVVAQFTGESGGKLSTFIGQVKAVFTDGVTIVTRLWDMFGKNIVSFLQGWVSSALQIVGGLWQMVRGIFQTFSALLKGDWSGVWDGIKLILRGVVNVLVGLVHNLWNTIKFAFKNAGVVVKAIFGGMWSGIKSMAGNAVDWLVDRIRAIPGKLLGLHKAFAKAGKSLIVSLASGIKNAAGFASDFAGEIWEAVKDAINGGIDKLNGLLEFDMKVKGVGIHVNAPDIGHLARGTNNWRGGWTVVGEEGPELANLPGGTKVVPHAKSVGMMRGLGGGGGGVVININGALDPVAVGRQVEQALIKYTRATNRPLQVSTL